ncbi:ATP-binding protein, partial [mine drainage metagenome]
MSDVEELRARLAQVLDPELGAPITELGMVGEVTLREGVATIAVALTTAGCPLRHQIERDVREAARGLDAVHRVDVLYEVMSPDRRASLLQRARTLAQDRAPATTIPTGSPVLMVGSGKGGVGKSSITANLAVALARTGRTVGVLDADVWGFSLTRLLGVSGEIEVRDAKMRPLVAPVGAGEIRLLSMGLLADEERALLWRGLMVQKAVAQFIEDADWSGVDYL